MPLYSTRCLWIHLPHGFRSNISQEICLHLQKSLYGTKIAPLLWLNTCIGAFKALGFIQTNKTSASFSVSTSSLPSIFDDAGIGARKESTIDKLVKDLCDLGFERTKEGSFTKFLGIQIMKHRPNGINTRSIPQDPCHYIHPLLVTFVGMAGIHCIPTLNM
jgi:hypothetical protein